MGFIIKIALFCAFCYGAYSLIPQPASSPSPSATAASGSIDSGLDDPIDPAPVEKRKTNENGFAQSVKFASLPDSGTRRSSSTEVNRITPRGDRGFVPFPVRVPSLSDRAKVNHARQSGEDEGRDLAADDFGEDYSPPASSGRSSGGNQTFVQSSGGTKALRVVGVVCKASVARTGPPTQRTKGVTFYYLDSPQGRIPLSLEAFKRGRTPIDDLDDIAGKRVRLSGSGYVRHKNGAELPRFNSISQIEFSKQ